MNEEIVNYLRSNLKINFRRVTGSGENTLNVELFLDDEMISSSYVCLNEDNTLT